MRSLRPPTARVSDVVTATVPSLTKLTKLASALSTGEPNLTAEEARYLKLGASGHLHQVPTSTNACGGTISTAQMKWLYKYKLAQAASPAREIYDELILMARGGICPLCSHRTVKTTDHYLPKALFPNLALTPLNLIPSCSDCNRAKLAAAPNAPEDCTIHPYFDSFDGVTWIGATVRETTPVSFEFFVVRAAGWNDLTFARATKHFNALGIGDLYATQAASEFVGIRFHLAQLARANADRFQSHLRQQAVSRRIADLNSWQAAMYDAMLASAWFLSTGVFS